MAQRDVHPAARCVVAHRRHHPAQVVGRGARLGFGQARHQHGKTVARIAAQQVVVAQVQQQHVGDGLQRAVALGLAVLAVDAVEGVDIEQHQRANAVRPFALDVQLRAQVGRVGQLGDAVERPVVAKQPFALAHVVRQRGLLAPPIHHAGGQNQHPQRQQRLQHVVPQRGLLDIEHFIQAVGPRPQHDAGQAPGQQARDHAVGPAGQHQSAPQRRQQGRAALAGDVHQVPCRERDGRTGAGKQEHDGAEQAGDQQNVADQGRHGRRGQGRSPEHSATR